MLFAKWHPFWWCLNTVYSRYIVVGGVQAMVPRYNWERDISGDCHDTAGLLHGTFVSWWYLPRIWPSVTDMQHYYHARYPTDDWHLAYVSQNQLGLPRKLPHLLTTSFVMVISMITGSSLEYFIRIYLIIFQFSISWYQSQTKWNLFH